jgi:hypothetical protein
MNPKLKFMWIDDDEARKKSSLVLEKLLGISMEFVNLRGKFLRNELDGILSRPSPDLVLLDHRLDRVAESLIPKGSIATGSTVAEIIREKWLECPIVCVTAVEIEEVALHKRERYEDVFRYSNMSQYYGTLLAIAHSFRLMKKNRPQNLNDLLNLLKAPMNDRVRLTEIAPKELKGEFEDKGILLSISKWVRHILMARPGFLYDRLWAATLLGIKEPSFGKIAGMFEKAKYTGIFSDSNFPLWWKSKMQEILYKKDPNLQHLPTRL